MPCTSSKTDDGQLATLVEGASECRQAGATARGLRLCSDYIANEARFSGRLAKFMAFVAFARLCSPLAPRTAKIADVGDGPGSSRSWSSVEAQASGLVTQDLSEPTAA
jgi:hypothetical protein